MSIGMESYRGSLSGDSRLLVIEGLRKSFLDQKQSKRMLRGTNKFVEAVLRGSGGLLGAFEIMKIFGLCIRVLKVSLGS